jgi:hypothetical protein
MGKHIIASSGASIAMFVLSRMIDADLRVFALIPQLMAGLVIYLVFLVLLGEFTKEDYHFFMDMIHPGKMGGYILSEIKE